MVISGLPQRFSTTEHTLQPKGGTMKNVHLIFGKLEMPTDLKIHVHVR